LNIEQLKFEISNLTQENKELYNQLKEIAKINHYDDHKIKTFQLGIEVFK